MSPYSSDYHIEVADEDRSSARTLAPWFCENLGPRSVVDIGCGTGHWLIEFKKKNVEDVLGVDGPFLDRSLLEVGPDEFISHDLSTAFHYPRRFDLVVCLEVAEHLPRNAAQTLVRTLIELGDVILFSAAVPGQTGENHVNEQWPSYWASLFDVVGYKPLDVLRPHFWETPAVKWWYSQNMILYVAQQRTAEVVARLNSDHADDKAPLPLVHPRLLEMYIELSQRPLSRALVSSLTAAVRRKLRLRP